LDSEISKLNTELRTVFCFLRNDEIDILASHMFEADDDVVKTQSISTGEIA